MKKKRTISENSNDSKKLPGTKAILDVADNIAKEKGFSRTFFNVLISPSRTIEGSRRLPQLSNLF